MSAIKASTVAQDSADWIEWSGGKCPVADNARVVVNLRRYGVQPECFADTVAWKHSPISANDIIAYYVVQA